MVLLASHLDSRTIKLGFVSVYCILARVGERINVCILSVYNVKYSRSFCVCRYASAGNLVLLCLYLLQAADVCINYVYLYIEFVCDTYIHLAVNFDRATIFGSLVLVGQNMYNYGIVEFIFPSFITPYG